MDEARSARLAGFAGIAFSALSLAVIPLAFPPPPPVGATGEAVASYYAAHRLGFLVGNYLGVAAFVPGFVQLAVLAARVRRFEGPDGWLASLVLATGTFGYAVFACTLCVFQVLPFLVAPRLHDAAEAMGALTMVWFALDGLAALPFVLAVGWAARATGALPAGFVPASAVVAVLLLAMSAGSLTATPAWLAGGGPVTGLGFVGFFAWTLALGIFFLREARRGEGRRGEGRA